MVASHGVLEKNCDKEINQKFSEKNEKEVRSALLEAKLLFANKQYQNASERLEKCLFMDNFDDCNVDNAELIYYYGFVLFTLHKQHLADKSSDMIIDSLEKDLFGSKSNTNGDNSGIKENQQINIDNEDNADNQGGNEEEEEDGGGEEEENDSLLICAWENAEIARNLLENSKKESKLLILIYILLVEINIENNNFDLASDDVEIALQLCKKIGIENCQNEMYKCLNHSATINLNLSNFDKAKDLFQECLQFVEKKMKLSEEERIAIRSDLIEKIQESDRKLSENLLQQVGSALDTNESLKDIHDKEAIDVTHMFLNRNKEEFNDDNNNNYNNNDDDDDDAKDVEFFQKKMMQKNLDNKIIKEEEENDINEDDDDDERFNESHYVDITQTLRIISE